MRRVRRFSWLKLLPVLAWVLVQIGMGTAPLHAAAGDAQELMRTLGLDRITICTPTGLKTVEKDQDGDAKSGCGWCAHVGPFTTPTPSDIWCAHRVAVERLAWLPPVLIAKHPPQTAAFDSRAPPARVL